MRRPNARRRLDRVLAVAAVIAGLGVPPGMAQDAPQPGAAARSAAAPMEAAAAPAPSPAPAAPAATPAKTVEPAAAASATVPASDPAKPGEPIAQPEAAAATPARIPPAADAGAKKVHDLTPMGMFLSAGPVVQAVMIVLAGASIMTWIILLARGGLLLLARRRMSAAIAALRDADGLADAAILVRGGVAAKLLLSTDEEVFKSRGLPSDGIKERALMILQRIEARDARRMASGTGILATIGSIGPFIGLLGTVWGIMSSFIGIADSNTTSLAVVAPGIAEALLATGIGLAAAIPAVIIYNALARSITGYRAMVADAVALVMSHLSRDLDRREAISCGTTPNLRLAAE